MPLILSPPPPLLHDSLSFRSLQTFRALPSQSCLVAAASEPCVKVAGVQFADPADPIACYKSFRPTGSQTECPSRRFARL